MASTAEDYKNLGAFKSPKRSGQNGSASPQWSDDLNNPVGSFGLRIVLIGPNEQFCSELSNCLREAQCGEVRAQNYYPPLQAELDVALGGECDVVIIELDSDPDHALGLVKSIRNANVAKVMVCSSNPTPDVLMRCMRAGAREFLELPIDRDQVVAAMVRTAARRQTSQNEKRATGKLMVFMGTKGGAGVTTIATNFAIALAEHSGAKTMLLDLDLPLGDVALNLGLTTDHSTIDALEKIDRLDSNMLSQMAVKDRSGLHVLPAPGHYVSLQPSESAIKRLLDLVARSYDYVVIDVGSRLDLQGTSLFQIANQTFLVSRVDVADLRNCNRLISQYFGSSCNNIEVVLSRYKRNLAIDDKEIARLLSAPVRWKIPSDEAAISTMHSQGVPLIHGSNPISKAIRKMVEELVPQGESPEAAVVEEEPVDHKAKSGSRRKAKAESNGPLSIFSRQTAAEEEETAPAPPPPPAPAPAPTPASEPETRAYKGMVYVKGEDNKWHVQGKAPREMHVAEPSVAPQIEWPEPRPVDFGTALSEIQLNATANVEGALTYEPAAGEVLAAGTHTLTATFAPEHDPDNPIEYSVQFTVNKLTPVVEWTKPNSISYGTVLGGEQLNAQTGVDGSFVYNPLAGTTLPEGTHALSVIFVPEDQVNYNTAVSVVSLVVSRRVPEIEWPDRAPISYGTPLSGAELNAKATVPGTFIYTPTEGTVLAAGVHKLMATFVPEESEYYREAKATVTMIVARATPDARWKQPPDIVYGTPVGSEHFAIEAKVPGSFEFSAEAGEVLCAGRHTLIAYFAPDDVANYSDTEFEATLTIAKSTPTLNWNKTAQIVYGTPLSDSQLNAEASIAGAIEYTPGPGNVLPAGQHTITARFTPADPNNYEMVEAWKTVAVEKAMPVVDWPTQLLIPFGTQLGDQMFRFSTSVAGSLALTPSNGEVLPAGTHIVHAVFLPQDSANYKPDEADISVQIAKAFPIIAWETPQAIVYGLGLTERQLNATATVPGHFTYVPELGEKLGAGQHTITALFVPDDVANYQSIEATVELTVEKAVPAIQWPEPKAIDFGEELGEKHQQAQSPVPGSFAYTPAAGEHLEAGTHRLTAVFTPVDAANYVSAQASVKLTVNKLVPTLVWSDPAPIAWGTPLSSTQLNAQAGARGSFVYEPAENVRLTAGTHTLSVVFLPEDSRNYAPVQTSTSIIVKRATPSIAWNPVSPILFGTPLGPDQLNAETEIPGVFVYRPQAGTILEAGTIRLTATFLPEDDANHAEADGSATIVVEKAIPVIGWRTPDAIEYGMALGAQQLNAAASVSGVFTYMPPPGTSLAAGSHTLTVFVAPDDNTNYLQAETTVTLEVKKATPRIIWAAPEPIITGNPLSVAQLNAKASVPGKFAYIPRVGSVLPAGTHTIEATFVPADAANYAPVQTSVNLNIIEVQEVMIDWKSPAPIRYGARLGPSQLNAKASVPGTFVYSPPEGTVLGAGTRTLTVTFIPDDDSKYAATDASVTLVVKSSEPAGNANVANTPAETPTGASGSSSNRFSAKRRQTPEAAPQSDKREIRVYKGATYVKEDDGQWHLQK